MNDLRADLASAFPADEPSAVLKARVHAAGDRPESPSRALSYSIAGLCAVLAVVAAIYLPPKILVASALSSLNEAVRRSDSYRLVETVPKEGGGWKVVRTALVKDAFTREISGDTDSTSSGFDTQIYYPKLKLKVDGQAKYAYRGLKDLRSTAELLHANALSGDLRVDHVPFGGVETTRFQIRARSGGSQTYVYADSATSRPFRIEVYRSVFGQAPRLARAIDIDYSYPIDESARVLHVPTETRVVTEDELKAEWQAKFAGGTVVLGTDGKLVVRYVAVSREGYVYVVYTGGGSDWRAAPRYSLDRVAASRGRPYVFIPSLESAAWIDKGKVQNGFLLDGQIAQVRLFAPAEPQAPKWPLRLTLTFAGPGGTRYDFPVSQLAANTPAFPEFLPLMASLPANDNQLRMQISYAQGESLVESGQYAEAERLLRKACDQAEVFEQYDGAAMMDDTRMLYYLGRALKGTGKNAEALDVLQRALVLADGRDPGLADAIRRESKTISD